MQGHITPIQCLTPEKSARNKNTRLISSNRTGAKCLSASQIPKCGGLQLHDSHSEILAIRAFNCWLVRECRSILAWEEQQHQHQTQKSSSDRADIKTEIIESGKDDSNPSPFVKRRSIDPTENRQTDCGGLGQATTTIWPPFELRNELRVYMYCTCSPCGDASMELCMAAQDDPAPWELPAGHPATNDREEQIATGETIPQLLDGRAHFSVLGVVRRKPSRRDAEATLSKSCSDKLALKQITSLLSFPASLLVAPTKNAYLSGLILPEDEISRVGCERAFGEVENGRMKPFSTRAWDSADGLSYRYVPFTVKSVPPQEVEAQWPFGKPKEGRGENTPTSTEPKTTTSRSKPGNISAIWISAPSWSPLLPQSHPESSPSNPTPPKSPKPPQISTTTTDLNETLINGVKQGYSFSSPSPRKGSVLSRARMWELFRETISEFNLSPMIEAVNKSENGKACFIENGDASNPTTLSISSAALDHALTSLTYEDLKRGFPDAAHAIMLRERVSEEAKDIMGSWIRNRGDEGWGMEVLNESERVKRGKIG